MYCGTSRARQEPRGALARLQRVAVVGVSGNGITSLPPAQANVDQQQSQGDEGQGDGRLKQKSTPKYTVSHGTHGTVTATPHLPTCDSYVRRWHRGPTGCSRPSPHCAYTHTHTSTTRSTRLVRKSFHVGTQAAKSTTLCGAPNTAGHASQGGGTHLHVRGRHVSL